MAFVAIVLIIVVAIYSLGDYGFSDIVHGLLVSEKVDDDFTAVYNQYTIQFDAGAYQKLQELYFADLRHEFAACLQGTKEGLAYHVTDVLVPDLFSQSVFSVVSGTCDENTIIRLHSHPYKRCVFSPQDIYSYYQLREKYGNVMLGLMCEPDRFTFYREG